MNKIKNDTSVLFVCMGNICRSPAAEGVFRHFVEKAGYAGRINIDSAGTLGYHAGDPADPRMRQAAVKRGYTLDSIARQVRQSDITEFELLVAMDLDNFRELMSFSEDKKDHIRMLWHFLENGTDSSKVPSVPDPYYGGDEGFDRVLDMIESACPLLLEYCKERLQP